MAAGRNIGRRTEAKAPTRENAITPGGIETAVRGFFNDVIHPPAFEATYGDHKTMGSDAAPIVKGGRGGAKTFFRNKLNSGGN